MSASSPGSAGPHQLRRLLDAVISLGSDLDLDVILRNLVETGVDLVGATYGALGVLDPERTHLSDFITVGIDEERAATIGELPKGHGILGLLITEPRPIRMPRLTDHAASFGFRPGHPDMTSFLGVPVIVSGQAYGNLYLTDKVGAPEFTDVDEELAVALAAAAGTVIEKARLHAQVRDLEVVEDRDRIARELHDNVIQRLFATGLSLQGAVMLADDVPAVAERIEAAVDELDQVVRQIRSTIFELHAPVGSGSGLRQRCLQVGEELSDALGFAPTFRFDGPVDAAVIDRLATDVVAVVRESLANVARHSRSPSAAVSIAVDAGRLAVVVDDEGIGPGDRRPGGEGVANMEERAVQAGGTFTRTARRTGGTRVEWSVPLP